MGKVFNMFGSALWALVHLFNAFSSLILISENISYAYGIMTMVVSMWFLVLYSMDLFGENDMEILEVITGAFFWIFIFFGNMELLEGVI